jgi:Divergent CRAL/TRIO domain
MSNSSTSVDSAALYFRLFVSDPIDATLNQIVTAFGSLSPRSGDENRVNQFLGQAAGPDVIARVMHTSDVFDRAVNEIIQILDHIEVPVRKVQLRLLSTKHALSGTLHATLALSLDNDGDSTDDLVIVPILSRISRSDILRFFLASGCSHKKTVIRLVESVTWMGLTFPIDIRLCRIELQNGQFFQQGFDKLGNPVLYFRNMLRGYWRKDVNSCMASILHRFEDSIQTLQNANHDVRFTLVVMMGKPHKPKAKTRADKRHGDAEAEKDMAEEARDGGSPPEALSVDANDAAGDDGDQPSVHHNPRVDYQEHYHVHSDKEMIRGLIKLLLDHYPERLFKAYVVVGHGNTAYTRTAVGGSMMIANYIQPARTREKIKFLIRYSDLQKYIDIDQLPTIAGGTAPVTLAAFEYR